MERDFDEVGNWSEIKLKIIREYAKAYSRILKNQPNLQHHYVDGFSGPGIAIVKNTREIIPGSPLVALEVDPPFHTYHFIDVDGDKIDTLRELVKPRPNVHLYNGDCNTILTKNIFPQFTYNQYRRALCFLDPYKLTLDWKVIHAAGQLKTVEIILNFPLMHMNRAVLWSDPDKVNPTQQSLLKTFWGDDSWRQAAYSKSRGLFDDIENKKSNVKVVNAFRERLISEAGFEFVPEPLPMRNSKGSIVYYLLFASPNKTGAKIANDIFKKYRYQV